MGKEMTDEEWQELSRTYLKVWIDALRALLGWSREHAAEWFREKWGNRFDADDLSVRELFYHRPPEYYIAAQLTRELVTRPITGQPRVRLLARLAKAMRDPEEWTAIEDYGDADWQAVRQRVGLVLSDYGIDLPPVADAGQRGEGRPTREQEMQRFHSYKLALRIEVDPLPPNGDIYCITRLDLWNALLEAIRKSQRSGKGSEQVGHHKVYVDINECRCGYLRPPVGKTARYIADLKYDVRLEDLGERGKDQTREREPEGNE
ncbi:hypothetical protein SAMN05444166_8452 [Singulisphaera sp. GP187]|nr:hypothetical protein SAMN05444166_8452 [Singulisphaera sp. GP187]